LEAPDAGWLSLVGFSPDGSQLAASSIWDTCVWDLRLIGQQLGEIGLAWELPSYGPAPPDPEPVRFVDATGYDFGGNVSAYVQRAESLARQGKWAQAAIDTAKVADWAPLNHKYWCDLAVLRLAAEDVEGYRWACREMLARFEPNAPNVAEQTAKACLLAPDAVRDYAPVMRLAEFAVTGTDSNADYKWFALARGMADYRVGEFSRAIEWCNKSLSPGAENPSRDGLAQAFMAMTHHRLGQADIAREALEKAHAMQQKLPKLDAGDESWSDVLRLHIVRREAEELLNEKTTPNH
jgi:tetratricopeptide (TPR) repeat protein